jgi:predicted ATP-binding protein involved in virulence
MILKNIKLTNFRCFNELFIELHPRLNVFVGKNGQGKTAILDGIARGLGRIITELGVSGIGFKDTDLRKKSTEETAEFVQIQLETTENIVWSISKKRKYPKPATIPKGTGLKQLSTFLKSLIEEFEKDKSTTLPVFAYYGTNRAVLDATIERRRHQSKNFSPFEAYSHSLDAVSRFKSALAWFDAMETDELKLKQTHQDFNYRLPILETVRNAITSMMPEFINPRISTHPLHFIVSWDRGNGVIEDLRLEQLSDGYRTMLALIIDLARRMAQTNPHIEDPLQSEAIVLIDEIDLHLHPEWQQKVLPDLLKTFPNTQFIVTTHSHQVLTTIKKENLHILEWNSENGVNVYKPLTNCYGAESSRILEEIMNVPSRPESRIEEVHKLYEYLDLVNQGYFDSKRAQELRQEIEPIFADDSALDIADRVIRRHKILGK